MCTCPPSHRLLEEHYPRLFTLRCLTHKYSLVAKEVGSLPIFSAVVKKVNALVTYINLHDVVLTALRKQEGAVALTRPAETRFAGEINLTVQVVKSRTAIRATLCSETVLAWAEGLDPAGRAAHDNMVQLMTNTAFWADADLFMKVTEPVVHALRVTDSDSSNLHVVARAFYLMVTEVQTLQELDGTFEAPPHGVDKNHRNHLGHRVAAIFSAAKPELAPDLALAAAFVNPQYVYGNDRWVMEAEAQVAYEKVATRYFLGDAVKVNNTLDEVLAFRGREGMWGDAVTIEAAKATAPQFWKKRAGLAPVSAVLNGNLCGARSSQSGSERFHKYQGYIVTSERNRLGEETITNLAQLKTDLRFLDSMKSRSPHQPKSLLEMQQVRVLL